VDEPELDPASLGADEQNRSRGRPRDRLGDASQQEVLDAMTPVSPDDDEIRVPPRRVVDDHAAHALAIRFEQLSLDGDADLASEPIGPLQHSESGLAPHLP
jgi:hypothetical protein